MSGSRPSPEEELAHDSAAISLNHQVYAECRRHAALSWRRAGADYAPAAAPTRASPITWKPSARPGPSSRPFPRWKCAGTLADELTAARDAEEEAIHALKAVVGQGKVARV